MSKISIKKRIFLAACATLLLTSCGSKKNAEDKKKEHQPLCIEVWSSLSPEEQQSLSMKETRFGVTIDYILRSGRENPQSKIGCYAGDAESYTMFNPLFKGVVDKYHLNKVNKLPGLASDSTTQSNVDTLSEKQDNPDQADGIDNTSGTATENSTNVIDQNSSTTAISETIPSGNPLLSTEPESSNQMIQEEKYANGEGATGDKSEINRSTQREEASQLQRYDSFLSNNVEQSKMGLLDVNNIPTPTKEQFDIISKSNKVVSTRLRVARNLKDFPFPSSASRNDFETVEKVVLSGLTDSPEQYLGNYFSLVQMPQDQYDSMLKDHLVFESQDKYLKSAGILDYWPNGRGVYLSQDKEFMVWINEEDHMRIILLTKGSNLEQTYNKFNVILQHLTKQLDFAHDSEFGYLSSCPTNIGTGMRASVHVKLSNLSKEKVKEIGAKYNLAIRGSHGENSDVLNNTYDISNSIRLGLSEQSLMNMLIIGLSAIIEADNEAGNSSGESSVVTTTDVGTIPSNSLEQNT